jgi:GNAT superfamily N-acetyltransferase
MADPRSNDAPLASGRVVIRRYRPGKDGNWLRQLPADATPAATVKGDDASSWIAEVDGRAAGILTWQLVEPLDEGKAIITRLWIEPAARQRGIATQLYRRAVSEVRKQYRKAGIHLQTVLLQGETDDQIARAFAESLKFDIADESDTFIRHI